MSTWSGTTAGAEGPWRLQGEWFPDGTSDSLHGVAPELPYNLKVVRREREGDYLSGNRWNECIAASAPTHQVLIQVDDVRVRPDFVDQHVRWQGGGQLTLVTRAKFEGDRETWDPASCPRARLAGADGSARELTAWTAVWGASLSYPRALVAALWREPFERPFDERMTGWASTRSSSPTAPSEPGPYRVRPGRRGVPPPPHAA